MSDRYENARREVAALVEEKGSVLASRQVLGLLEWVVGELTLLREEMGMGSSLGTMGRSAAGPKKGESNV